MPVIEISASVWEALAARGKFGETEDDVLRRVFKLPPSGTASTFGGSGHGKGTEPSRARRTLATQRMSSYLQSNQLHVSFHAGPSQLWALPERGNRDAIREVRDKAVAFARDNGATVGQQNAVKKTLTEGGYYLMK